MTETDCSCCNSQTCVTGPSQNTQAPFIQHCAVAYFESFLCSIAFFSSGCMDWHTGCENCAVIDLINEKQFKAPMDTFILVYLLNFSSTAIRRSSLSAAFSCMATSLSRCCTSFSRISISFCRCKKSFCRDRSMARRSLRCSSSRCASRFF